MGSSSRGLLCAACSLIALALAMANPAQGQVVAPTKRVDAEKQDSQPVGSIAPTGQYAASAALPDSPGSSQAQEQAPSNQKTSSAPAVDQTQSPNTTQGNAQTNQKLQRPVGTAAAEAPRVSGITAAEPAGVAIAPAKQHRVRTIAIKVGAIIGASAAIGTVIALTAATPSKPPGAH
jgi:hypothetical protein